MASSTHRQWIRALIDAIVLTPDAGKLRVDLTGALAGILSVAQKDQRPRPEDEASAEQIKMAAGARNRLYLLLFAGGLAARSR